MARRTIEVFSLSFMDCICCGFGAILLLFVLSKGAEPQVVEAVREDLSGVVRKLEKELFDLRGETLILNRDLKGKQEQLSVNKQRLALLQGDLSKIEGEFASSKGDAEVQNQLEGRLAAALQTLTAEQKRLLALQPRPVDASTTVGGIPIDSEYVIFIIDTSGSMQKYAWPLVVRKLEETLKVYPKVEGIQVMSDQGYYMFPTYGGKWIPDTPARRQAILTTLRTWQAFSVSSPVKGIQESIRTFHEEGKKISLYVFGDEFDGNFMNDVVTTVDKLNRVAKDGRRMVRIHAVAFPTMHENGNFYDTGVHFATLMRALCERNGGTFVALNTANP